MWLPRQIEKLWLPPTGFAYRPWRFLPCPSCCPEECPHCTGSVPSELTVTIEGMANWACSHCTELNESYVASYVGTYNGTAVCQWRYTLPEVICTVKYIDVELYENPEPGSWTLNVLMDNISEVLQYQWTKLLAVKPDCAAFNETLNPVFRVDCLNAGSTATVAA